LILNLNSDAFQIDVTFKNLNQKSPTRIEFHLTPLAGLGGSRLALNGKELKFSGIVPNLESMAVSLKNDQPIAMEATSIAFVTFTN